MHKFRGARARSARGGSRSVLLVSAATGALVAGVMAMPLSQHRQPQQHRQTQQRWQTQQHRQTRSLANTAAPAIRNVGRPGRGGGTDDADAGRRAGCPVATQKVIVLGHGADPAQAQAGTAPAAARADAVSAAMAPIVSQVAETGAKIGDKYTLEGGFAATVSAGTLAWLKSNPNVTVIPDSTVTIRSPAPVLPVPAKPSANGTTAAKDTTTGLPLHVVPGACAPSGQVQLDPESLSLTGTDSDTTGQQTARSLGFTGAGVTVAWMADGIDPDNANFLRTPAIDPARRRSATTRTSAATAPPRRPAAARRSSTPTRSPGRARSSTTSRTSAPSRPPSRARSGSRASRRARTWSGSRCSARTTPPPPPASSTRSATRSTSTTSTC